MFPEARQIRSRLLANAFGLRRLLAERRGFEQLYFRLKSGKFAVNFRRLGFGIPPDLFRFGNSFPNGCGPRGEPRPAILCDQITQSSGENGEIGPCPNRRNAFGFPFATSRRFELTGLRGLGC